MKTGNNKNQARGTLLLHVYVSQYYCRALKEKIQERGVKNEDKR